MRVTTVSETIISPKVDLFGSEKSLCLIGRKTLFFQFEICKNHLITELNLQSVIEAVSVMTVSFALMASFLWTRAFQHLSKFQVVNYEPFSWERGCHRYD